MARHLFGKPFVSFIYLACLWFAVLGANARAASTEEQIAAVTAERNDAIFKVQHIVNQPVTRLKRTPDMQVATYSPGWFHEGAITPDFDHVDVRRTQEGTYESHQYVTSDLNPGFVFLGRELEFNPMTKFFYTDRTVPKKRLTEAEMLQINDLYRIIGRCDQKLEELKNPPSALAQAHLWATTHKPIIIGAVAALAIILFWLRRRQMAQTEE